MRVTVAQMQTVRYGRCMTRLLIAYDGSPCSEWALLDLQRAGFPDASVAEVLTLADFWLPETAPDQRPVALTPGVEKAYAHAALALEEARAVAEHGAAELRSLFPRWQVHAHAHGLTPAWGIVERAHEWRSDVIVMGSHSRSRLQRLLIGSVAQTVLTHVDCAVRIARVRDAGATDPPRILVGVDGSEGAEHALAAVAKRAWPTGTLIRVATSVEFEAMPVSPYRPGASAWLRTLGDGDEAERHILDRAVSTLASVGLRAQPVLLRGSAKDMLLDEATRWPADCIFVGARGLSAIRRLFLGSVSTAISARAPCSVEVIRG
jgi:nucleotide-binding universal stress UspA family protein